MQRWLSCSGASGNRLGIDVSGRVNDLPSILSGAHLCIYILSHCPFTEDTKDNCVGRSRELQFGKAELTAGGRQYSPVKIDFRAHTRQDRQGEVLGETQYGFFYLEPVINALT